MLLAEATENVEYITLIMGLMGGLALFLYGMELMTEALKKVAGNRMKSILATLTTNRFMGVFVGTAVTAIIQSSSVTTVMVVGFISAGLMTLQQSVGVILGSGIGTTITAQIVAFKVTKYSLALLAIGFLILFTSKRKRTQQYGIMIMGLGMVFFGMSVMSETTKPLRTYQPFIDMMKQMEVPLYGILAGMVFTAIIQSSSASVGVVIALATQGLISLEAGIALAFGANIGTTITALLSSIGKPREAVQAAVLHTIFRITGMLIWLPFIPQLGAMVTWMSPSYPELSGFERMAAETPRQIANAHTIFNVAIALMFIPFPRQLVWMMNKLIPIRVEPESELGQPNYLDDNLLTTPGLALDRVHLELGRLGELAVNMVHKSLPTVFDGEEEELANLAVMDEDVDSLHAAIVTYLGQVSQGDLLSRETNTVSDYMAVANHIENIADMVETNLVEAGSGRIQHNVQMSAVTRGKLAALHEQVSWAVESSLEALASSDEELAEEVMAAKLEINRLANDAEEHLAQRLIADEPNRLETFRIEIEIIEYLKRVYYFAKRIAKVTADADLVYRQVALLPVAEEGNRLPSMSFPYALSENPQVTRMDSH